MGTAKFAGCRGLMPTVPPRKTGHTWAKDGTLLRVGHQGGLGWVATQGLEE